MCSDVIDVYDGKRPECERLVGELNACAAKRVSLTERVLRDEIISALKRHPTVIEIGINPNGQPRIIIDNALEIYIIQNTPFKLRKFNDWLSRTVRAWFNDNSPSPR